ncbi:major facilitator superfamily domain-containing protein [Panaeolus papilionaceus]|nr:major facilitator superfamily domain-containing protein [Panaeolus papilionaceus]
MRPPPTKPRHSFDIEHVPVKNDPRAWLPLRKNISLALIASASMIAGLSANIQNPAVEQMEQELPATSEQFSLSISVFILIQGVMPLLWSVVSEVKGRKLVYVVSLSLFTLGTIIVALSHNIGLVIGFRSLQAAGSSAVMSIGAASLADIFDPVERGRKMGIYYIAPLLGPAMGPIFGGALTSVWNWRAIFWFLAIVSGTITVSFFFFFRDTFRKERSTIYQNVLKQRMRDVTKHHSGTSTPASRDEKDSHMEKTAVEPDVEKAERQEPPLAAPVQLSMDDIKVSIIDVNPFKPLIEVLRRKNNLVILFASGLLFAFNFLIVYTSSRTLSRFYSYPPFKIGLVTLAYGLGAVSGSILGGRYSDRELAKMKEKHGGVAEPEMRLKSILFGAIFLPPCVVGFGWICKFHVHISAVCVFLFLGGFFSIWIYASTLAYIVDANNGRSSTAVAANSAFRGISAFVATEIAVPLQVRLSGWMYTIWGGIMALAAVLIMLVCVKGERWRHSAEDRERRLSEILDLNPAEEVKDQKA